MLADHVRGPAQWIGVEVGVTRRRLRRAVAQQFADNRQSEAGAGTDGRKRVAEIMQADAIEFGMPPDRRPGPFQVGPWPSLDLPFDDERSPEP